MQTWTSKEPVTRYRYMKQNLWLQLIIQSASGSAYWLDFSSKAEFRKRKLGVNLFGLKVCDTKMFQEATIPHPLKKDLAFAPHKINAKKKKGMARHKKMNKRLHIMKSRPSTGGGAETYEATCTGGTSSLWAAVKANIFETGSALRHLDNGKMQIWASKAMGDVNMTFLYMLS